MKNGLVCRAGIGRRRAQSYLDVWVGWCWMLNVDKKVGAVISWRARTAHRCQEVIRVKENTVDLFSGPGILHQIKCEAASMYYGSAQISRFAMEPLMRFKISCGGAHVFVGCCEKHSHDESNLERDNIIFWLCGFRGRNIFSLAAIGNISNRTPACRAGRGGRLPIFGHGSTEMREVCK